MAFVIKDDGARVEVSPNLKGSVNEHIGTAWLLKQGYDVFRNVSPNGRADLIARKWDEDDFLAIDVKSEGYDLDGLTPMAEGQREQAAKYESSGIRYLVVKDDGTCRWWDDIEAERHVPANDNHWVDPATGQRFLHPRNEMSQAEWSFFCVWLLKNHRDKITEDQFTYITGLPFSDRGKGRYGVRELSKREKETLRKIHRYIYKQIVGVSADGEAA